MQFVCLMYVLSLYSVIKRNFSRLLSNLGISKVTKHRMQSNGDVALITFRIKTDACAYRYSLVGKVINLVILETGKRNCVQKKDFHFKMFSKNLLKFNTNAIQVRRVFVSEKLLTNQSDKRR